MRARIANWLMPRVAANATVWPSMHAQHAGLLEDIKKLYAALQEAHALIGTAEQDGYVSPGWREDARSWRHCWADVGEWTP